jgi:serine/threonine protein kinase
LIDFGKVKPILNPPAKKYTKYYTKYKRSIQNTYDYIAPEVLNGNPPTPASDIYSFGMIIKAIGETTGDTTLFELGQLSSSTVSSQRPTIIGLLSALNPYTKRSVKT